MAELKRTVLAAAGKKSYSQTGLELAKKIAEDQNQTEEETTKRDGAKANDGAGSTGKMSVTITDDAVSKKVYSDNSNKSNEVGVATRACAASQEVDRGDARYDGSSTEQLVYPNGSFILFYTIKCFRQCH